MNIIYKTLPELLGDELKAKYFVLYLCMFTREMDKIRKMKTWKEIEFYLSQRIYEISYDPKKYEENRKDDLFSPLDMGKSVYKDLQSEYE